MLSVLLSINHTENDAFLILIAILKMANIIFQDYLTDFQPDIFLKAEYFHLEVDFSRQKSILSMYIWNFHYHILSLGIRESRKEVFA